MFSVDTFKALFPAFEDVEDSVIAAQVNRALPHFDVTRWGDLFEEGVMLFVAHHLELIRQKTTGGGAVPGSSVGVASVTVDQVSVSFDTAASARAASDPYQRTEYGIEYAALRRLVGMGAIAV